MLKARAARVTVKIHRINPDYTEEEQATKRHKRHKRISNRKQMRLLSSLFFCAFCAFLWLTLLFQISRLRRAFATASVFECT